MIYTSFNYGKCHNESELPISVKKKGKCTICEILSTDRYVDGRKNSQADQPNS